LHLVGYFHSKYESVFPFTLKFNTSFANSAWRDFTLFPRTVNIVKRYGDITALRLTFLGPYFLMPLQVLYLFPEQVNAYSLPYIPENTA